MRLRLPQQESWIPPEFGPLPVDATVQEAPTTPPAPPVARDVVLDIGLPAGTPAAVAEDGTLVLPTGTQLRVTGTRDGRIMAVVDNDAPPAPRSPIEPQT